MIGALAIARWWVAAALAAAPSAAGSGSAPPPTPWAQAGARSWTLCRSHEREAELRLRSDGLQIPAAKAQVWRSRAALCPGAPAVQVLAAMIELGQAQEVLGGDLAAQVEGLARAFAEQRRSALASLERAARECERRGVPPPPPLRYLEASAAYGLGDLERAAQALAAAAAAGEVERWRIDRLGALIALGRGEVEAATRLAHRARIAGPLSSKSTSGYVFALAIDRAGAIEEARRELVRVRAGETRPRAGLDALLPVHERLYLVALEQEARGQAAGAIAVWQVYLAQPAVPEAERVQALRRVAELGAGGGEGTGGR